MIYNIAILGSTGSIGSNLLQLLKNNKKKFKIHLLTANKDYKKLLKQAKFFNVKNIILTDKKNYLIIKKKYKHLNIYNDFDDLNKIFKKKIDYCMSSISGFDGLKPTLKMIKFTKKIAIANKEAIICGWPLIKKELKNNKTSFIPVDSEHFSILYCLKNTSTNPKNIEKVYLTASGGPFLNFKKKNLINIEPSKAVAHPNWKMGKKISIDSSTMMNKIFEVIEAKNIFDLPYKKISILLHPNSYVHAIVKFKDGFSKIIIHETTMKIPILKSLCENFEIKYPSSNLDLKKLNNLNFKLIDEKKFPLIKILAALNNKTTLLDAGIVCANDELVNLFLSKKIKYTDISKKLLLLIKSKFFLKLKNFTPKNIDQLIKLNNYVRLKVKSISI